MVKALDSNARMLLAAVGGPPAVVTRARVRSAVIRLDIAGFADLDKEGAAP